MQKTSYKQNEKHLNKNLRILVLKRNRKGLLEGMSEGRINVSLVGGDELIGTFQNVRIISLKNLSMHGELI